MHSTYVIGRAAGSRATGSASCLTRARPGLGRAGSAPVAAAVRDWQYGRRQILGRFAGCVRAMCALRDGMAAPSV